MDFELAPAKINLALHVRHRRGDGYHDIETLFAFTAFGDRLRGKDADTLCLTADGPFSPGLSSDDNLVIRAARALADAAGITPAVALHLEKNIPVAAGLGGGSADAAATLRLLNRFWRLDWPLARLAEIGAALGADVPACLYGGILLGTARGDKLIQSRHADLAGKPLLLINPRVAVPTAQVFAGWDGLDHGALHDDQPLNTTRNDLTVSACTIAPMVQSVLDALWAGPAATLIRMSGSGATCFALYESTDSLQLAAQKIAGEQPDWWVRPSQLC